ncbi:MAG: polysulfide reductase [Candidatus Latescibacteria bacterium]|nr:polysulfide reductase [Candidatus Latescibacterota bacterium]
MNLFYFIRSALGAATGGGKSYHLWMGCLTLVMLVGGYAYSIQLQEGLAATHMTDHVSWGLYISNFTFLVGLAAAAVMLVLPAYVLHDVDFARAVLIGEGVAVAALMMCLSFVVADLGSPMRAWHLVPVVGFFNFPQSLLAWDVLVLNGYLLLNLLIPFYLLYTRYCGRQPRRRLYVPFVYLSVFWAVSIHMVTAFLLAGLPARPFWNSSLMAPRFLASAFAAGPAFMILACQFIRTHTKYSIPDHAMSKLAMIATVAAQINLIMLGSEIFKEFYYPTHHSQSATYLFFGLHGHNALVPWMWTSVGLNLVATATLSLHPLRRRAGWLTAACMLLFVGVWMEKGIGLIVPGFIPSPLGEIVEYVPSGIELAVTLGIWAMGLFVFTVLVRVGLAIELGQVRSPKAPAAGWGVPDQ